MHAAIYENLLRSLEPIKVTTRPLTIDLRTLRMLESALVIWAKPAGGA